MTELAYPFDAGAGTGVPDETSWSNMLRSAWRGGDGVIYHLDRAYDLNRLECYADSTGMQVKVKSGRAQVRGFHYLNDAERTLTIAAAHATLARVDNVVLHLDTTANTIALEVMTGTPSGSPVGSTITNTATQCRLLLAQIAVGAAVSTVAAGNVLRYEPVLLSGYTPGVILRRTTNQTIPHGVQTSVAWTATDRDTDAAATSSGLTCKTAGWYHLAVSLEWAFTQVTGLRFAFIVVGRATGGSANVAFDGMAPSSNATAQNLSTTDYLNVGDTVAVAVLQTNGASAALDLQATSRSSPRLSAVYVGP